MPIAQILKIVLLYIIIMHELTLHLPWMLNKPSKSNCIKLYHSRFIHLIKYLIKANQIFIHLLFYDLKKLKYCIV